MVCLNRQYHFKSFAGCLPNILIGPFLNILSQIQRKVRSNLQQSPISMYQRRKIETNKIDQEKFVEDSLNFTWSIIEHIVPYIMRGEILQIFAIDWKFKVKKANNFTENITWHKLADTKVMNTQYTACHYTNIGYVAIASRRFSRKFYE